MAKDAAAEQIVWTTFIADVLYAGSSLSSLLSHTKTIASSGPESYIHALLSTLIYYQDRRFQHVTAWFLDFHSVVLRHCKMIYRLPLLFSISVRALGFYYKCSHRIGVLFLLWQSYLFAVHLSTIEPQDELRSIVFDSLLGSFVLVYHC